MKKIFYVLLVIVASISCDKQGVFEEFLPVSNKTWNSNDIKHFNANISDSTQSYNVLIGIRNTSRYEYSNLYLFVTVHSPNGAMVRDTVEIKLADDRGKWFGKGAASIYTLYYPFKQNIKFPFPGIYIFDIEQAMWKKDLKYIHDVGLRIEKYRKH
jgi:gliding motility-associated lipoprotein GldH